MPSFFDSCRHAPPLQTLTRETADPNAATAAASAFMRRGSNASLSFAAAAAALRARPVTPTNVAEVQSKRAHRRSPSLSAIFSRGRGAARDVRRTPSVSSMRERTFRSPSPPRNPAPLDRYAPPVPSLPNVEQLAKSKPRQIPERRGPPLPLQIQPFRTASDMIKNGQHGSWFSSASTGDAANVRRPDTAISLPDLESHSRSVSPSINFSYPRASMPSDEGPTHVYDANSRRMVPREQLLARSQSLSEAKPKKKKHDVVRTGSRLSRGTGDRTQVGTLMPAITGQPMEQGPIETMVEPPKSSPLPALAQSIERETTAAPAPQEPGSSAEQPHDSTLVLAKKGNKKKNKQQTHEAIRTTAHLQWTNHSTEDVSASSSPFVEKKLSAMDAEPEFISKGAQQPQSRARPAVANDQPRKVIVANNHASNPETNQTERNRLHRERSSSPARSTRFAPAISQLLIRHEPPPRSVSPKKSAMKFTGPRDRSPSDAGSEAVSSQTLTPQRAEDAALTRKKSPRVSWDDRNSVIISEPNQPRETEPTVSLSPQSKKPWYSVVTKHSRKEHTGVTQDETMGPRPVLPLFGSVREKKQRDIGERPLVRPSERTWSQPASTLSGASQGTDLGSSSDSAIGTILAHENASKNAANISKYREPLPGVKPAMDGNVNGADRADGSSDDGTGIDLTTGIDDATALTPPSTVERLPPDKPGHVDDDSAMAQGSFGVPVIVATHFGPAVQDCKVAKSIYEQPILPGGFPMAKKPIAGHNSEHDAATLPATALAAETATTQVADSFAVPPISMEDIHKEDEEADRCSICSDANEEFDQAHIQGFMSLDAVVESSPEVRTPERSKEPTEQSVSLQRPEQVTSGREFSESPLSSKQTPDLSNSPRDWENAKAYWRSLSIPQRRQLEFEALSEADSNNHERPWFGQMIRSPTKAALGRSGLGLHEISYQIMPGTKWLDDASRTVSGRSPASPSPAGGTGTARTWLRGSMRSGQSASVIRSSSERPSSMRKSLRVGSASSSLTTQSNGAADAAMRSSLRDRTADGGAARPASYHASSSTSVGRDNKPDLCVEDFDVGYAAQRKTSKAGLRRRGSDDSVSSFKRARASSTSGHGFRRSLRDGSCEPSMTRATRGSGRFSLRSVSPSAFRRQSIMSLPGSPVSMSGGPGRMRSSLRSQAASPSSRTRMSSFKPTSLGGRGASKARSRSRFADSSDEGEGGPSIFTSRFADSSDEDVPGPRTKGRGLAKTLRTARSANMDPAHARDDDEIQEMTGYDHAMRLKRSGSGRGMLAPLSAAGQDDDLTAPNPHRASLLSILRRKKGSSGKIRRDRGESAACRNTRLERSAGELGLVRSNSHRERSHGGVWPLRDPSATVAAGDADGVSANVAVLNGARHREVEPARPSTALGLTLPSKARAILNRRHTSMTMAAPSAEVELTEPQKRKRFGALRRMLRIHD